MDESRKSRAGGDALSRRGFLKLAGAGAVATSLAGSSRSTLAGSSGSNSPWATSAAAAAPGKPKRGGTLRCAFSGGTAADNLDGDNVINLMDHVRTLQLYDSLVAYDNNAIPQLSLGLAEEITPNANATLWTIRLRPGVTFHNGKDLEAEDVIYTFQRIVTPKKPLEGAPTLSPLDVKNLKALDKLTVQVPCLTPFSTFVQTLPNYTYMIVPVGFDLKNPIGTGPFKFQSFTPGVESIFVRNENYWNGPPYVDELVMTDFATEESQIDALLSGQADLIDFLSASAIKTVTSGGGNIQVTKGGSMVPFTMRTDVAPFNDVRVRQAMRLAIDRQAMLETVFLGNGIIGNDITSYFTPLYDHAIPQRHQDIAQAKFLLKQAGYENLSVELITAPMGQGAVTQATVLAEQVKAAGINVSLKKITVTEFFGANYLKWVFAQDTWTYFPYFPMVAFSSLANSPANETHFDTPKYQRLYNEALATVDETKQKDLAHEMQMIQYDSGGYIIPFFSPTIDGYSKNVHGVQSSLDGEPFGDANFKAIWLD